MGIRQQKYVLQHSFQASHTNHFSDEAPCSQNLPKERQKEGYVDPQNIGHHKKKGLLLSEGQTQVPQLPV